MNLNDLIAKLSRLRDDKNCGEKQIVMDDGDAYFHIGIIAIDHDSDVVAIETGFQFRTPLATHP